MAIPGNLLSVTTETVDPNTSGWAAKLNCAIALGSGGQAGGAGCLRLTSAGSGEMQARTFSSAPVTPGQLYFTFADAASSTQAERIGIRWLNAAGAEVSVTWSLTTVAASASWHRISVAGVAPVGAARAQILVSAVAAGAGAVHYFENVYLGPPIRLPGNMVSFNAEAGGELDLSAWGAETNCTLSRQVPIAMWGPTYYYAGGHQIALTVTANGTASALCTERVPVTEGAEYAAATYLCPPTTGSSVWVELRFYNAAGTQLQANRATLAPPGTGWYRQITSGIAPADAVTASIAVGITSGTAGQVIRTEGAYIATVAVAAAGTIRTGNVLPMQDWDFEAGVGSWTVASGPAAISRSTPWGVSAGYDSYALAVSSATASTSVLRSGTYSIGDAAGQNWRHETFLKTTAGGWTYRLGIRWLDASAALISTSTSGAAPVNGVWINSSIDFTAPAGAVAAQLELTLTATSPSSALFVDRPALFQTLPLAELSAWPATASTRLILRELPVGQVLTVWRIGADGSRTYVRGSDGLYDGTYVIPSDSLLIEDYEVPLGVPVTYRVVATAADGSTLSDIPAGSVTVTAPDINWAWLTDPGRPGIGLKVLVKTAPEWQQPIEQAVYRVRGRSDPVIRSDVRGSRTGDLMCWTTSDEERDGLRFLLSTGNILLWRCAPGTGEPDVYVNVAETQFPRVVPHAREQWREWTLPMTEVAMPTGGQAGSATWTVRDVVVENATGWDVIDRYATVFDLATNRRKA